MKRLHLPDALPHRYRAVPPRAPNKRWRVLKETLATRKYQTVNSPAIDALNEALTTGKLKPEAARNQIDLIIEGLYRADGARVFKAVSNEANASLVLKYYEFKYKRKDITDKEAALGRLKRAVDAIGDLSLVSASAPEIEDRLSVFKGVQQRERASTLNQMLKWLGRDDVKITLARKPQKIVRYLTAAEFALILPHLPDDAFRLMAEMAFYTGCRIGELFALNDFSLKRNSQMLSVLEQINKAGDHSRTKNGKTRNAYVFPRVLEIYSEWLKIKDGISLGIRYDAANKIKAACKKVFPKNKNKWLNFHDLRHSYAVELFRAGVNTDMVAKSLGNSVAVCEEYYIGFIMDDDAVSVIKRKVEAAKQGALEFDTEA